MRGHVDDVLFVEADLSLVGAEKAVDGFEEGRFTHSICAEYGRDLAAFGLHGDALEDIQVAVVAYVEVIDCQHYSSSSPR